MQSTCWNERSQNHETVYGLLPNVFFKHSIDKINTGKLLLPAEGEGRNAVYAAKIGWDVTAFDYSEIAKEKALKMAQCNQVAFAYQTTDFLSFEIDQASMDAVALIYAHMPPEIRSEFHHKVAYWVKQGGHVILEAFNPLQLELQSGGPKDVSMLYTPEMLKNDFPESDWEIVVLETVETELSEGPFHEGKAQVIRLLACRR
ncbi:MAG: hypothetical protein RIT07_1456 [Bacteroidota bacterium]